MQIGQKINILRKNADITQEQLAEQLHVTRQTISKWESGVTLPDIESVVILSRFFHVSLEELLTENDREAANNENNAGKKSENGDDMAKGEKSQQLKSMEELARINRRNRIIILVVMAVFIFALGLVLGSIFVKKMDHTTSRIEYSLYQYMELEGRATALVDTNAKEQVLLVADTYDDGTGKQISFVCEVYYTVNNKVKPLGVIMSGGTAYPIASDWTGIYTASGHSIERYEIDEISGALLMAEGVYEIYDTEGNVRYEKEEKGVRSASTEAEFMELLGNYSRATTVVFQ